MSNTPRTDEIVKLKWDGGEYASTNFARKLETELDAAKEEIAQMRAVLNHWKEDEGADAKRMEWVLDAICVMESPRDILSSRKSIDTAMETENNEQ